MVEFHLFWLEKEDLEYAGRIIKNVAEVSTVDGAIKWALRQCATQWKKTEPPVGPVAPLRIPIWNHLVAAIPMKKLAQLEHTVAITSVTLERLVPDKKRRLSLFGDETS